MSARSFSPRWRSRLRWPLPVLKRVLGRSDALLDGLAPLARARHQTLAERYDLAVWPGVCNGPEYLGNLYWLDALDTHLGGLGIRGPALDVGAKRWWYLPALASFLPGRWDGVELSARQRGRVLDDWWAHAQVMCRPFSQASYLPGSVTALDGRYGFVTWFLPYVAVDPLLSQGLSPADFQPERLLGHVWQRLDRGGILLVVNQGWEEVEIQEQLFAGQGIRAAFLGEISSVFFSFGHRRYGWLAGK